jgi:Ca2+-binding RTX toxin-like protein
MQYDLGNFGGTAAFAAQNRLALAQQITSWAAAQGLTLDAKSAEDLASQLALHGGALAQAGAWISVNDRDVINQYLQTASGQQWVYNNLEVGNFTFNNSGSIVGGTGAVTAAVALVQPALRTDYFQRLSPEDQQTVSVLLLKEANQSPVSLNKAISWLKSQSADDPATAQSFYDAQMGSVTDTSGLQAAWNATKTLAAIQSSNTFSAAWQQSLSNSLDNPTASQDPNLLALKVLFSTQATPQQVGLFDNHVPGTLRGNGQGGFLIVDKEGNVVALQSAVSNGDPGSNQNAPATAQGWTQGSNGSWAPITEGIGRGSQYFIQYSNRRWRVVAEADDGSQTPLVDLTPDDQSVVNFNGVPVALDSNAPGAYLIDADGDLAHVVSDGSTQVAQVLTGQYAGSTVTYEDRSGGSSPFQLVSLADTSTQNNNSSNYQLTIDDGKGNVTVTSVTPITENLDGSMVNVGWRQTATQSSGGVTQSVVIKSSTTDPISGARSNTTDTTTYTDTGDFASHQIYTTGDGGSSETVVKDASGATLSVTDVSQQADGTPLVSISYADGTRTVITVDSQSNSQQIDYASDSDPNQQTITQRAPDGSVTLTEAITPSLGSSGLPVANTYDIVQRDGSGAIVATGDRVVNPIDGSYDDRIIGPATLAAPLGTVTVLHTDASGKTAPVIDPTGAQEQQLARDFNDTLALVRAIQHHQPLPALGSGLSLYNDIYRDEPPALMDVAGAINVVTSFQGLNRALNNGDVAGAALSGANLYAASASLYGSLAKGVDAAGAKAASDSADAIQPYIQYLTLANDLAHKNYAAAAGDAVGIIVGAEVASQYGMAVGGPVGAAVGFVAGIFFEGMFGSDPPPPWGQANAYWDAATGTIKVNAHGQSNGDQAAAGALNGMVGTLENVAQQYDSASAGGPQIGVIAQRLGGITYDYRGFQVNTYDPATGAQLNPGLVFDATTGKAVSGVDPSNPAYFATFGTYYLNNALARGALAPQWEVQTAEEQQAHNLSNAGLSEVERDANLDLLASPPAANASTQEWNPIGLDLGGGLSTVGATASGVQFNVAGTADLSSELAGNSEPQYQYATDWLNSKDGFLVLDKNINGTIDNGDEMFSNSQVAEQARGISSLATWDANGDGVINASDPIYAQLQVWKDANGDGRIEQGEVQSLADLGITGLDYRTGKYVTSSGEHQMSTLRLQASETGQSYQAVPGGIQVSTNNGESTIVVTQVHDLSSLQANTEGIETAENTPAVIAAHGNGQAQGLLDGVSVSNAPNAVIDISSVGNAQHGTVTYDATSDAVTFTPDANYSGTDAGFDFVADAGVYGQKTVHVQVQVDHVSQGPTITGDQLTQHAVYGYQEIDATGDNAGAILGYQSLYAPGYGYAGFNQERLYSDDPTLYPVPYGYGYHDQPVATETDQYSGDVIATDPDFASSDLTWSIVGQAHHGTAAIDQDTGHWTFSNPEAIGGSDGFLVQVQDPNGKTAQLEITVPLPDPPPVIHEGTPVVLDLTGSGFQFQSLDTSNVFFQSDTDGWRHRTAWFSGGNGVLALDTHGDGIVHDSSQIAFQNLSTTAQTDLQGLAALDTNHDGVIDKNDAQWNQLGAWVDANQDGVCEAGEFKTLDQLGITSISLQSNNQFSVDNGVTVHGETTFTWANGTTGQAADVTLPTSTDVLAYNSDGSTRVTQVGQANQPITAGDGDNVILGYQGDNVITAGNGHNVIQTGEGNDLITVGNGDNTIMSGDGKDLIGAGDGNNSIVLGGGDKYVIVGKGSNLISGGSGNELIFAGDGNNVIYAGSGSSLIRAGNGNNTLLGGVGHNELFAGNGDNTFNDGGGVADMYAGTGNNTFIVTNAADTIAVDQGGVNTVKTTLNWTLGANQQVLWGLGHDALTLRGNDLGDQLIGNGAADTLIGGAGNDTLADSGGAATLIGGGGDDTFVVTNRSTLVEAAAGPAGTVKTSVSYTLPQNVHKLVGTGFADLTLTGGDQDGVAIQANSGNDTLVAGSGIATLVGGSGSDTFVVNNTADVVQAQAGFNTNTIKTSVSYAASDNVTVLSGTGSADITLTGNALDDVITANGGNDTLVAGSGDDVLIAGSGKSTFIGGSGTDSYELGNSDAAVRLGSGDSYVYGANGAVSVTGATPGSIRVALGDGNDQIDLSGSTGTANLTLGNGNNTVRAGNGATSVQAGAGNNAIALGDGTDRVTVGSGINQITLGNGDDQVTAGDGANTISAGNGNDALVVGNGANQISLGDGADSVIVGDGANTIRLGEGSSSVTGGAGNNHLAVADRAGAAVRLHLGDGNDTVALGDGNDVVQVGDGADTLTLGNGSDSVTFGNGSDSVSIGDGNNQITGGDGANTLTLGTGSNQVNLGNGANHVTAADAAGTTSSYAIGSGSNVVTLSSGNDTVATLDAATSTNQIQAGDGNDQVTVGDGSDLIQLGNGNDGVRGGNGADTAVLGTGSHTVLFGNGNDVVKSNDASGTTSTITLGNGDDKITLGDGNNSVAAGNGTDVVTAGNGANVVTLGGGQDVVDLGNGANRVSTGDTAGVADSITVGDGDNTIAIGQGSDTIIAGNGSNAVTGGNGADRVTLGSGNNTVQLGNGNDTVTAGDAEGSADAITLGSGNDKVTLGNGNDRVIAGDGTDDVQAGDGNNTVQLGNGNDQIVLGNGNNAVQAGNGADRVTLGSGSNSVTLGDGADAVEAVDAATSSNVINAGNGTDTVTLADGTDSVIAGNGNDTITLGNGNDTIRTGDGNSRIQVGNGNNSLAVGKGNNTLVTGSGANGLHVGTGNNTVYNHGGADTLYFDPSVSADSLRFGVDGADLLVTEGLTGGSVRVVGGYGDLNATIAQFIAGDGNYTVQFDDRSYNFAAGNGTDVVTGGSGNDVVTLGNGNDTVQLANGNDQITLGNGNSQVTLGNGNDLVKAGNGANAISLGTGTDTVLLGNGNNSVKTADGVGTVDTVQAGDGNNTVSLSQGNDRVTLGNGANTLTGGNGADTVTLGTGSNSIALGNGNDAVTAADAYGSRNTVTLGDGTDSVVLANGNNVVNAGNGTDTVKAGNGANTVTLGSGADSVLLGDGSNVVTTADIAGIADTILAGNGNNQVTVAQGNDRIAVGNGNNAIRGGNGYDVVTVGSGSNTVVLGNGGDTVTGVDAFGSTDAITLGNGTDVVTLANGNDAVTIGNGSDRVTLGDGNSTVQAGNGNNTVAVGNGNNTVTVGRGNNTLVTGSGVNALHIGTGQETITNHGGTDTVYLDPTVSYDSLRFSASGSDVLLNEYWSGGSVRVLGAYNNPSADIAQWVAGNGNYSVQFDSHSYSFAAGDGWNTVWGGSGNDTVTMGNGSDYVSLADGNDAVSLGNGYNTVYLGNGNDKVTLGTGSNSVWAGNGNDTVITHDKSCSFNQILLGCGNDTVTTGDGTNVIVAGSGNDVVSVGAGSNSITLGNGANQVTANDAACESDTIQLGYGNNRVSVGQGWDWISAGNGNNVVTGGNGSDTVTLGSGSNSVTLGDGDNEVTTRDASTSTTSVHLGNGDNEVVVGSGTDTVSVGNGCNSITTGTGHDTISVGDGYDAISTNGGSATITVGTGQYDLWNNGSNDHVVLTAGASNQLWFERHGSDLEVEMLGTNEELVVHGWFRGNSTQTLSITAADGHTISGSDITKLVQAMASAPGPTSGQVSYTQQEQQKLAPTLASVWH